MQFIDRVLSVHRPGLLCPAWLIREVAFLEGWEDDWYDDNEPKHVLNRLTGGKWSKEPVLFADLAESCKKLCAEEHDGQKHWGWEPYNSLVQHLILEMGLEGMTTVPEFFPYGELWQGPTTRGRAAKRVKLQ